MALMASLSAGMPTASLSSTADDSTTTYCPPRLASPAEKRQIFEDFIDLVFVQRDATTAYLKYVAEAEAETDNGLLLLYTWLQTILQFLPL